MKCSPTQCDSGHWHCAMCGYTSKTPLEKPFYRKCKIPGLGDRVSSTLSIFGITKARVRWVRSMFGINSPCGCEKRQELLNEVGNKLGL